MILLKLDFKKAYNTVNPTFLPKVLEAIGVPTSFIDMVNIFFKRTEIVIIGE
jgi:hypothetical protein